LNRMFGVSLRIWDVTIGERGEMGPGGNARLLLFILIFIGGIDILVI